MRPDTFSVDVAPGVRLHVEAHGPSAAPRVLVLPGALAVGRAMLSAAVALRRRYRVLLVDPRGHGASTRFGAPGNPWEALRAATFVADALALADSYAPAALVGVSLGGVVAGHVAARRPRDVRALALLASAPEGSRARRAFFARAAPDEFPTGQRALWERWHGADYWRDLARHAFAELARERPGDYPDGALASYRGPALVLHGVDDALVPVAEADAFRGWMPQADVRRLPGDHAFFAGAGRESTNRALAEFLDGALRPASADRLDRF